MQRESEYYTGQDLQRVTFNQDSEVILSEQFQLQDEQRLTTMSYIFTTPQQQHQNPKQAQRISKQANKDSFLPLVVEVIVTSQKQIHQIKVKIMGREQTQKAIYSKSEYIFLNTNINIFIIKTSVEQLMNLKVQIVQKQKGFLMFSKKIKRQYNLHSLIIHQEAGLHFDQLIQKNKNFILQNYCIIAAQQHLTKNLRKLGNSSLIPQFYYLFKTYFKLKEQNTKQAFLKYEPSIMNIYICQFYLYFFYSIYKNNSPRQRAIQFQIEKKIKVKKLETIRQNKYYRLFKDWKSNLLFLLYVYFEACLFKNEDQQNFKDILQWNILNQDQQTVKQMIGKLVKHEKYILPLLHVNKINNKLMQNQKITFAQYLHLKIRYIQERLKIQQKEEVSELLMRFIDHTAYKAKSCYLKKQILNLPQFKYKILFLFVTNQKLKEQVDAAELYNKLKSKCRYFNQFGQFFINTLKSYILAKIPQLLIEKFELSIISLVIKPQIAQQNNILLNHFQKQNIKEQQIVFIFRVWQEMKHQEYNINVIQFVILKFVAFNPHFDILFLKKIINIFTQQLKDVQVTNQCKKNIPLFCEKIMNEIKTAQMKEVFAEWRRRVQQDQDNNYQTIIIE